MRLEAADWKAGASRMDQVLFEVRRRPAERKKASSLPFLQMEVNGINKLRDGEGKQFAFSA